LPEEQQLALREYGFNLGIVFQLVDDLLDYTADAEVLGKPVGGDVREGKMTLPAIYLLQQDGGRARGLLEEIIRDRTISPASWSELRGLLTEGRVLDRAFEKAVEFATAAKRHLGQFPQTPELESLMALPDYILARDR
jgi:octaprenyl-diphosphate synthase